MINKIEINKSIDDINSASFCEPNTYQISKYGFEFEINKSFYYDINSASFCAPNMATNLAHNCCTL